MLERDLAAHLRRVADATASGASVISCSRSRYSKMRSNSASALVTSTWTFSRLVSGKKRRDCSAVKATMVPSVRCGSPRATIS